MTTANELADRLLDAQVAFVVAELTGSTATTLIAEEVHAALDAVEEVPLRDLIALDALQETVRTTVGAVGDSPGVSEAVPAFLEVMRGLAEDEASRIDEVVPRDAVVAIVDVLAGSTALREEVLERLGRSPAVSALAMRFVSALVGDAVAQNRERAEKVPGAKSLLGVADFAARQARGMAPKQLEKAVGGAADKGAQAAMDRVSRALMDAFDEDAVRRAAMELWDDHARDQAGDIDAFLAPDEVDRVAADGFAVWLGIHRSSWFTTALDAAVLAFFDRYGDVAIGGLLGDFGLTHEIIADEVARHAPAALETLREQGHLEAVVRRRLEPFFRSEAASTILEDA